MSRLPYRVRLTMRHAQPVCIYTCPGCHGRYQAHRDIAGMWAAIHAFSCPDLRILNRSTLACWNCGGDGRVSGDGCLVCLGRGYTTEPKPVKELHV